MRPLKFIHLLTWSLTPSVALSQPEVITRDVCILGGGGTGSYAAVQLKERNHSVVVVEQKNRLGGHSDTLYLPTGEYIDYGIRAYFNVKSVRDFFNQLNVDYELFRPGAISTQYVNLRTGRRVDYNIDLLDTIRGMIRYRAALEPFDYLSTGAYYLPDEVPEALLRPFREFVEEHSLQGALELIYTFADALGDILATPLLFVIQFFGTSHINALLKGPYIRPKNGTAAIFRAVGSYIDEGRNVLYEANVTRTIRNSNGVELNVDTPGGSKLIRAKKLLVTFPPILPKLQGFDLDQNELSIFSRWLYVAYHAAVLNNTGIPDGLNVFNMDPNNQPGSLPVAPFECILDYSGVPGYYGTRIVGADNYTEADAGTFPINASPDIVAFASHLPNSMRVSVDDVRDGFYKRLYALQGQRSTYYTGYSFCTDYSAQLWNYTRSIVDMVDSQLLE